MSNRSRWIAGLLAGAAVLVALNWQALALGIAVAMGPERPELLADARWNAPRSARAFAARFPQGAPEAELVSWLQSSGFAIDRGRRTAARTIASLPCNEDIHVSWVAADGRLRSAQAVVSESGCL